MYTKIMKENQSITTTTSRINNEVGSCSSHYLKCFERKNKLVISLVILVK